MKKSKVIATCLVNSDMFNRIDDAENRVYQVSLEEFQDISFAQWNKDLNERNAEQIIKNVGRASMINVKKLIEDLW